MRIPPLLAKGLGSGVPAEFVIPTDLESDIIIGFTYETELMKSETPVGLRFDDLPAGILTLGELKSRCNTNKRIMLEASRHSFCYIIVTTDTSYRELVQHTPECRIYALGQNLRVNPLDSEQLEINAYAELFAEALHPFSLSDKQWLLLYRMLGNVHTARSPPTLLDLLDEIRAFLARGEFTDYGERRDAQFLERLVNNLSTGPAGACFTGLSQPSFKELLSPGITIIECPTFDRHIHGFLLSLVLAKVCATRKTQDVHRILSPLVLLLDDADLHLIGTSGIQRHEKDDVRGIRHWQQRLADVDAALHLSGNHPSLLPKGMAGLFGTLIVHRLKLKEDLDVVQVPLKLSSSHISPYSSKRESLYHRELLRQLEPNMALMTRPDLQATIPLRVILLPKTQVGITSPLTQSPASLTATIAPTMLHKDFTAHIEEAIRLLGLLREYRLTPTALKSTAGYSDQLITYLLDTLVAHRYVHAVEEGDPRHRRTVFSITPKGESALIEYATYLTPTTITDEG